MWFSWCFSAKVQYNSFICRTYCIRRKNDLTQLLMRRNVTYVTMSAMQKIAVQKPFTRKKQALWKLGIQERYYFSGRIFCFSGNRIISAAGGNSRKVLIINHYHHIIITPTANLWRWKNREFKPWIQPGFCAKTTSYWRAVKMLVRFKEHHHSRLSTGSVWFPLAGVLLCAYVIMTRQLMKSRLRVILMR